MIMVYMGGRVSWGALWYYLVGPLAGGAVAAFVFKLQNPVKAEIRPHGDLLPLFHYIAEHVDR